MSEDEILKLIKILIGSTSATGSHGEDMDRIVPNVNKLGSIAVDLVSSLYLIADAWENRQEASIQAVGKKARYWLDFIEYEVLEVKKDRLAGKL